MIGKGVMKRVMRLGKLSRERRGSMEEKKYVHPPTGKKEQGIRENMRMIMRPTETNNQNMLREKEGSEKKREIEDK